MIARNLPDPYSEVRDQQRFIGLLLAELYMREGIDRISISREAIEDDLWTLVQLNRWKDDDTDRWHYKWTVRGHTLPPRVLPDRRTDVSRMEQTSRDRYMSPETAEATRRIPMPTWKELILMMVGCAMLSLGIGTLIAMALR